MKLKCMISVNVLASLVLMWCLRAQAQEPPPLTKNYVLWAHGFLRTMYPDLAGKKYTLTLEANVGYDEVGAPMNWLELYVGKGPKDQVLGYIGGCAGYPVPPQLPWPPELGPRPTPPAPLPLAPKVRPKNPCETGPIRPKQYLISGFRFDGKDRLESFAVQGPGLGNPEAGEVLGKIVGSHPEMTDAEIVAALKKGGAKYGPNDKEAFIKNLPVAKLERFLGKLKVVSVGFLPLDENRNGVEMWPDWTVKVMARQPDSTEVTYEMFFEPWKGDLLGVGILPSTSPGGKPSP